MGKAQTSAIKQDLTTDEALANRSARPLLRLVHCLIDSISIFVLYFVFVLLLLTSSDAVTLDLTPSLLLLFATCFGYYWIMESRFQKTLGKFITKTRVINTDGSRSGVGAIFIRTLCRFIPFDNLSFLLFKTGFHDHLSKTTLIHD